MANPRYNSQVTQPRGNQTRVGKMGGGMMMQRPMYKAGGRTKKMSEAQKQAAKRTGEKVKKFAKKVMRATTPIGAIEGVKKGMKKFHEAGKQASIKAIKEGRLGRGTAEPRRDGKKAGGRIAGAARRAQQHGYYTPDMGMKGGKMYAKGGKVSGKKKIIAGGVGKIKNYPGIKKIIEMNKKGKKKFRDGGSAMKPVDKSKNPGLAKLPTQVRNKMGYMKSGGKVKQSKTGDAKIAESMSVKTPQAIKRITGSKEYKKADYRGKTKMLGGKVYTRKEMEDRINKRDGGMPTRRNTRRMNRLEELGRVDAEKGRTRKGKRNLRDEKKRIVRELKR
jgi:hypothetical protein